MHFRITLKIDLRCFQRCISEWHFWIFRCLFHSYKGVLRNSVWKYTPTYLSFLPIRIKIIATQIPSHFKLAAKKITWLTFNLLPNSSEKLKLLLVYRNPFSYAHKFTNNPFVSESSSSFCQKLILKYISVYITKMLIRMSS